jgi:hypothetical protein
MLFEVQSGDKAGLPIINRVDNGRLSIPHTNMKTFLPSGSKDFSVNNNRVKGLAAGKLCYG